MTHMHINYYSVLVVFVSFHRSRATLIRSTFLTRASSTSRDGGNTRGASSHVTNKLMTVSMTTRLRVERFVYDHYRSRFFIFCDSLVYRAQRYRRVLTVRFRSANVCKVPGNLYFNKTICVFKCKHGGRANDFSRSAE